jgi:triacylglycerol esterase/lipase EstA (alpha/beta hydrolase family)
MMVVMWLCSDNYANLWTVPIILIAHSFGGLVLKSLVVEVDKCMKQTHTHNPLEAISKDRCGRFLENLQGIVFYSVPHAGASKDLLTYFQRRGHETNLVNKDNSTQSNFQKLLEVLNRPMGQLSIDFLNAIKQDINIYAFAEGQCFENLVSFQSQKY